jgi:RHS repeat-associated protein
VGNEPPRRGHAMLSVETHRGNQEPIRDGSYGRFLYNFYRTYDPGTGRYLEADPVGQSAGINLFAYVFNDPIGRRDPLGDQGGPMHALPSPSSVPRELTSGHWKDAFLEAESALARYAGKYIDDQMDHCVALCMLTKKYGPFTARVLGAGHEARGVGLDVRNRVIRPLTGRPPVPGSGYQTRDWRVYNELGVDCGRECPPESAIEGECEDCCRRAWARTPPPPATPSPHPEAR